MDPESRAPVVTRPVMVVTLFWVAVLAAGFFFVCTVGLLVVLTLVSVAKVWVPDIETDTMGSGKYSEVVLEGSGTYKIAIIPVEGIITDRPLQQIFYNLPSLVRSVTEQLDQAADDKTLFFFHEDWVNQQALEKHMQSKHLTNFLAKENIQLQ